MEVLFFVIALVVMAMLAVRFGHDSRESAYSKEEESANFGVALDVADKPARRTEWLGGARDAPMPERRTVRQ